jgi:NADH-quinone oxidoreductase subunit C
MDLNTIIDFVSNLDSEATVKQGLQFPEAIVSSDKLHTIASQLKTNEKMQFDFLFCQTGVDLKEQLGVIYHLRSTKLNHSLVLKVFTADRVKPCIDSVYDIWPAAEFMEREIFDLVGIDFNNHPDMRRLFLEEDFVGHPLRKDFVDHLNIIEN